MADKKLVNLENPQFRGPTKMDVMESGKSDSDSPFGYAGPGIYPSPEGDALMGKVAEARLKGIYEAYGRGPNAVARMRLDPAYGAARAAGIQLPGDGMRGTRKTTDRGPAAWDDKGNIYYPNDKSDELIGGGSASTRYRNAGAAMRGSGEAKPVSETAFAGPTSQTTKGPRIDTSRDAGNAPSAPAQPSGGQDSPPKPISDPTAPATPASRESPARPPTVESTKGPRITTDRSQPSRNDDLGTTRGATNDEDRRVAEISMRPEAKDPNASQADRESAKMDYDKAVQSEARKDPFAKYRTEAGDTEIAQRTGEVQDRSRYGEDRVMGRQTYTSKSGKEMIGNQMQRPDGSTYFVGLPSADQNKADSFNRNVGPNFNQYNNYESTPKNYKASAEDIRANYAFGGGSGPGGTLVASNEDGLVGRNRSEFNKDVATFSAGSNNSGISSRGEQSPMPERNQKQPSASPLGNQQNMAQSFDKKELDFSGSAQAQSNYKGPEENQEIKKKKQAAEQENKRPLPV